MDLRKEKAQLRELAAQIRTALPKDERAAKSRQICLNAIKVLEPYLLAGAGAHADSGFELPPAGEGERVLFTYLPFRSEVDVLPIVRWCWQIGIPVVAPRSNHLTKQMKLFYINSPRDWSIGKWGIREPKTTCRLLNDPSRVAAVLVPGLAFDREGGRLGYGGGFYDRFFRRFVDSRSELPLRLALSFEAQMVDRVPMGPLDFKVDRVLTELESYPSVQD